MHREGEPTGREENGQVVQAVRWLVKLSTGVTPDGNVACRVGKRLARLKMYREVYGKGREAEECRWLLLSAMRG